MAGLDREQEQTLVTIVELVRSVPRSERHAFFLSETFGGADLIIHGINFNPPVLAADIRELASLGLLRRAPGGSVGNTPYDVTREGFAYYDALMRGNKGPAQALETNVMSYLGTEDFAKRHRESYAKWKQAADELWSEDTSNRMTSIGHHIREAMIAFAAELLATYEIADADPDPDKTVARLRAVIAKAAPKLGETERPMLDALVVYWGTVHDLAARQEHGATKAEPLVAEDARRVVFQTAVVMFELDRAFVRAFGK
jgi:hypothetical protein